jgi:hypothetical protein
MFSSEWMQKLVVADDDVAAAASASTAVVKFESVAL